MDQYEGKKKSMWYKILKTRNDMDWNSSCQQLSSNFLFK